MRAPCRPSCVEEGRVVVFPAAAPGLGIGVRRVVSDHRAEDARHVLDGAAHWPGDVPIEGERHHAVAAGEPDRRADADQREARRWSADRVAGVGAEPDQAEIGGDSRGGAPAGTRRHAVEGVRVAGRVEGRAHGLAGAEGPLGHVGLGEHDGARLADAADHEGVVGGNAARQRDRARGRDHVVGVEVVLDEHRHAEEGAGRLAGGQGPVEFVGTREGGGVDDRDRVDAVLVRLDTVEVGLYDHAAGGGTREDGLLYAGDGGLDDGDGGGIRAVAGGEREYGEGRGRGHTSMWDRAHHGWSCHRFRRRSANLDGRPDPCRGIRSRTRFLPRKELAVAQSMCIDIGESDFARPARKGWAQASPRRSGIVCGAPERVRVRHHVAENSFSATDEPCVSVLTLGSTRRRERGRRRDLSATRDSRSGAGP